MRIYKICGEDITPSGSDLNLIMKYMDYTTTYLMASGSEIKLLDGGYFYIKSYNLDATAEINDTLPDGNYVLTVDHTQIPSAASCPSPGPDWQDNSEGRYWYKEFTVSGASSISGEQIVHRFDCV